MRIRVTKILMHDIDPFLFPPSSFLLPRPPALPEAALMTGARSAGLASSRANRVRRYAWGAPPGGTEARSDKRPRTMGVRRVSRANTAQRSARRMLISAIHARQGGTGTSRLRKRRRKDVSSVSRASTRTLKLLLLASTVRAGPPPRVAR